MKCGSAEVALTYLNRAVDLEVLRFCLLFKIFFNSKVFDQVEDEVPLVVRSECFNKLDRPNEALEDAKKALELNPDNTR